MTIQPMQWYAIRVKSNREWVTAEALRGKQYEVCMPAYREMTATTRGPRAIEFPLFSGYVFCHFDSRYRLPILTIPGVVHIVGSGKNPQPVDAGEMESIFALMRSGLPLTPHPFPSVGRQVRLREGPLRGVEGIILAHKKNALVVSVSLLQRSVAIEIERDWIEPASFGINHVSAKPVLA